MSSLSLRSELNPPIPASVVSKGNNASGQSLLSLVRSFEKSDSTETLEEIVVCMKNIISQTSRRGILKGDTLLAERVLATLSPGAKEGKKRRGKETKDLTAFSPEDAFGSGEGSIDAQLIFGAIHRILKRRETFDIEPLSVALAADIVSAACEHIQSTRMKASKCVVAEYELLARNGKEILGALVRTLHDLLDGFARRCGMLDADSHQEDFLHAIRTGLRACSAIILIFGTKLARSGALIQAVQKLAARAMTVSDTTIVESAAILIARLPLAGGIDRMTPCFLWTQGIDVTMASLIFIFKSIFPVGKIRKREIQNTNIPDYVCNWVTAIEESNSEEEKLESFLYLTRGQATLLAKRLCIETGHGEQNMELASLDVCELLDTVEFLVSFPIAAETAYFTTKKRLRSLNIEGGLLSPALVIENVANEIKHMGCGVMSDVLALLGGPRLFPFSNRIAKISHDSLLISSSTPLRRVIEAQLGPPMDPKRRRWLQSSVTSRTVSVRMLQECLTLFGCGAPPTSSTFSGSTGSSVQPSYQEKGTTFVGGFIIEMLGDSRQGDDENWCSTSERIALLKLCLSTLKISLTSGGEFFSLNGRALIDSIAEKCLLLLESPSRILLPSVFANVIELATASISCPWPDGASSSLHACLRKSCERLLGESIPNTYVSEAILMASRVCEMQLCSRAPALEIVKRTEETVAVPMYKDHHENLNVERNKLQEAYKVDSKKKREPPSIDINDAGKRLKESDGDAADRKDSVIASKTPKPGESFKAGDVAATDAETPQLLGGQPAPELPIEAGDNIGETTELNEIGTRTDDVPESNADQAVGADDMFPQIVVDGGPDSEDEE